MADLLVDEGIGQDRVRQLRGQGLQAFHILEFLPKRAHDSHVFLVAQQRQLTIFTWNRNDFMLLAEAWRHWGHGDHYGVISLQIHHQQLPPMQAFPVLEHLCRDTSSYLDRVEQF